MNHLVGQGCDDSYFVILRHYVIMGLQENQRNKENLWS